MLESASVVECNQCHMKKLLTMTSWRDEFIRKMASTMLQEGLTKHEEFERSFDELGDEEEHHGNFS